MEKICVAVRVRPAVSSEPFNGTLWRVEDNRISLHKIHGTPISGVSYAFDHIFDESCTNARVYELLTKDVIHAAVEGFNGTAFAYGQTSSGKTFTMNGCEKDPGIIQRAVKDIFAKIQMTSDREFLIRVSYMEIYNEEINDLFAVENQKLQIHESLERGIFVAGLREEIVDNSEQVLKLIELGEVNRHFGETNMNARSSRSHTIFRMVIESKWKDTNSSGDYSSTDAIRVSVLNLVDLAGSERIAKTGADGVRLKEGKYINKSLMVLGNVINKLSDGAKQRAHIPYRDSKLTRILQPALGGNAKTSIICTIAPEEVHIEETKGTLQFASRAKRITNCAQVNEILTDAALLKRQKLEIEELRKKLQGSHAEGLEQVILKLRNDLLKYEHEREKLEMELQEERKSHKECNRCLREQQMKIVNCSNFVTLPEFNMNSSQDSVRQLRDECNNSGSICQGDSFRTPCSKASSKDFVVKRSNYSMMPDDSPLPDTFSNIADEDMWLKMNKGYKADLDLLEITPGRKVQSFPSSGVTPASLNDNHIEEIRHLQSELENATVERNELERKHAEQLWLNHQLMGDISELQQEAKLMQEIPKRLSESVANCKYIYEDVLSKIQSFVSDKESTTAKLLSSTSEIGKSLFTTLETHFSTAMDDNSSFSGDKSLIQEQRKIFYENFNSTIAALMQSQTQKCSSENKGGETALSNEELRNELNNIKERYHGLEKDLDINSQLLVVSKERYDTLEREFQLLKEDRDHLHQMISESSQKLALVAHQKENALNDLNTEVQRSKNLEEIIKQLASQQRSRMSFYSDVMSKCEKMRAQYLVSLPNSPGD